MKMNKTGFTLVELLAAMVILAILMGVAIPNIVGTITRQRNNVYVEDAKRLVVRARTTFSADTSINKENGVCFTLEFLDNGDFDEPPNGGIYLRKLSYVRYNTTATGDEYTVTLVECVNCDKTEGNITGDTARSKDLRGIASKTYTALKNADNPNNIVAASSSISTSEPGCKYTDPNA